MPIDANIIGGLTQPKFDNPLDSYGKALSVRNAQQQNQLGQQQLQAGQLAIQAKQRSDQDAEIARKAFSQAVQSGDPKSASNIAAQMGASADVVMGFDKHFNELEKQAAEIEDKKLGPRQDLNKRTLGLIDNAINDPNFEQNREAHVAEAIKLHPDFADKLKGKLVTKDDLALLRDGIATDQYYLDQAKNKREQEKAKQEADAAHRAAIEFGIKRPGMESDALSKGLGVAGQTVPNNQADWTRWRDTLPASVVQSLGITGMYSPAAADRIRRSAMTVEQQTSADQAAANAKQTAARDAQTAKNEAANVGIRQQQNAREQKIYDQTYGEGANQALVGVEPKLRVQATTAAQKAAEEHSKAMDSLRNVQSFIDLARSGNKAAGSNLPIMGAESIQALNGIRRINKTELDQYSGAGSLLDKVQGKIGKIVSGQPIPADVMKDIEELHKTIRENAGKTYNDRINSINQNYKSNFKPVESGNSGGSRPPLSDIFK